MKKESLDKKFKKMLEAEVALRDCIKEMVTQCDDSIEAKLHAELAIEQLNIITKDISLDVDAFLKKRGKFNVIK